MNSDPQLTNLWKNTTIDPYIFFPYIALIICVLILMVFLYLKFRNCLWKPDRPVVYEDLSKDREKILSLLEAGKITAEECVELINALAGSSSKPQQTQP